VKKDIQIKYKLIDLLILDLEKQLDAYENEMKKAQEEANYHKGAMASRYDTFKEEAQMLKDGFARQYQKSLEILASLNQFKKNITINNKDIVTVGSLVSVLEDETEKEYYILPDITYTSFEIENIKFECISSHTPLAKALLGKEIDDEVIFNNRYLEILDLF
jgi:transcription elongation GreA/GreB family factor